MVSKTNNIHVAKNRKMQKTFMADGLLEERFEDVSALPLWLHVGPASAHEPRVAEKTCVWSWPELKSLGNTIGDALANIHKLELDCCGPLIKQIGFIVES